MVVFRGLLGVIVGPAVLWAGWAAVVPRVSVVGAAAPATRLVLMAALGLALGAAVGGFLCTLIAGSANSPTVYVAIGVMLFFAARALVLGQGIEPDWYRLVSAVSLAIGFLVGASTAAYKMDRR
jgi:hypothetical protein